MATSNCSKTKLLRSTPKNSDFFASTALRNKSPCGITSSRLARTPETTFTTLAGIKVINDIETNL